MKRLLLFVTVMIVGCADKDVTVYKHHEFNVAFHSDWPTYGLPLTELAAILNFLDEGDVDRAKEFTAQVLTLAYSDAEARLEVVDPETRRRIEQSMLKAEPYLVSLPNSKKVVE